ncbi:MAG: LLM class flavin-dependent oxidoreductase, partial [Dehalococcoidia bacterium]|nr:LLM class flavin-dependent oxidoreductase [Dehalococcoidia bacterium]
MDHPFGPVGLMISGRQLSHELAASAREAEAAGFHSLWAGDGGGDVFSLLTAYAVHTSRVLLGSAVAVWHRPPVVAGSAAAQLQRLSDGRFLFGLGAGPKDWNEQWWGIPFDKPIGRMKEYIEVVRGSLRGSVRAPFSYDGQHFQITRYRGPAQPVDPLPPIWIGTVGVQMNTLAGRVADGVLFDVVLPIAYLREVAIPAVERGLRAAGRDRSTFTFGAMIACCIDTDRRTAIRGVKRSMVGHLAQEYFYPVWAAIGHEAEARRAQAKMRAGDIDGA